MMTLLSEMNLVSMTWIQIISDSCSLQVESSLPQVSALVLFCVDHNFVVGERSEARDG